MLQLAQLVQQQNCCAIFYFCAVKTCSDGISCQLLPFSLVNWRYTLNILLYNRLTIFYNIWKNKNSLHKIFVYWSFCVDFYTKSLLWQILACSSCNCFPSKKMTHSCNCQYFVNSTKKRIWHIKQMQQIRMYWIIWPTMLIIM